MMDFSIEVPSFRALVEDLVALCWHPIEFIKVLLYFFILISRELWGLLRLPLIALGSAALKDRVLSGDICKSLTKIF